MAYQRGLRGTGKLFDHLNDYYEVLHTVSSFFGGEVEYHIRMEAEFLSLPRIPDIIRGIINGREALGVSLALSSGSIALRAACPHQS